MKVLVSPEHARLSTKSDKQIAYVVWSFLRADITANNTSGHYTKSEIKSLCSDLGFTTRHWSRIFKLGDRIFWHSEHGKIHMRSMHRATRALEKITDDKITSSDRYACQIEIEITRDTKTQEIRALLYWSWFYARGEVEIARDTIQGLFGLSHDQQRQYDAILGDRMLVKHNYALVDVNDDFKNAPITPPEHSSSFGYERLTSDNKVIAIDAIQYQLPNTYIARAGNGDCPTTTAQNSLIAVIQCRRWLTTNTQRYERLYHANLAHFEAYGTLGSYVRTFYNGKRRIWRLGQYV